MPRKRFTNEQIAFALRQAENGATVDEVCRKMGVSEPTFHRWKKQFVGMGCRRNYIFFDGEDAIPVDKTTRTKSYLQTLRSHSITAKSTYADDPVYL